MLYCLWFAFSRFIRIYNNQQVLKIMVEIIKQRTMIGVKPALYNLNINSIFYGYF